MSEERGHDGLTDEERIARMMHPVEHMSWTHYKTQEITRLETDLAASQQALRECEAQWKAWGVVEIAARNPNVASYMEHWEGRAIEAESKLVEALKGKAIAERALAMKVYGNAYGADCHESFNTSKRDEIRALCVLAKAELQNQSEAEAASQLARGEPK